MKNVYFDDLDLVEKGKTVGKVTKFLIDETSIVGGSKKVYIREIEINKDFKENYNLNDAESLKSFLRSTAEVKKGVFNILPSTNIVAI